MPVLIGTSGWQYRDWKPLLYPDVPQRCWLERHAEAFATMEVNNAFYRLPDRTVFAGWAARTPADYVIMIKALPLPVAHQEAARAGRAGGAADGPLLRAGRQARAGAAAPATHPAAGRAAAG